MRKLLSISIICLTLFGCDLKPIDYEKRLHKSSFVGASSTQTGSMRKSHARMSISSSERAFKNRLSSRSYYNRNRNRRRIRKEY